LAGQKNNKLIFGGVIFVVVLAGLTAIFLGTTSDSYSEEMQAQKMVGNEKLDNQPKQFEKSFANKELSPITASVVDSGDKTLDSGTETVSDSKTSPDSEPFQGSSTLDYEGASGGEQSTYLDSIPDGEGECCETICKSRWDCIGYDWYGNIKHYPAWSSCLATDEYMCGDGMPEDTCDPEEPVNTFYPGGDYISCQRLSLCCNMLAYDCGGPDDPANEGMD